MLLFHRNYSLQDETKGNAGEGRKQMHIEESMAYKLDPGTNMAVHPLIMCEAYFTTFVSSL